MSAPSIFDADDAAILGAAYSELRALASRLLRRERSDHTLQTTALVHETFLKLGGTERPEERDRFLALAATAMRRVLVDHERARRRLKRGGGAPLQLIDQQGDLALGIGAESTVDILALDEALGELAELAPRQSRIVELRFHGGLENVDVARILGTSERTVEREWALAKTYLRRRLGEI